MRELVLVTAASKPIGSFVWFTTEDRDAGWVSVRGKVIAHLGTGLVEVEF